MPTSDHPLARIKHIVVLMLENRSFDNILGFLYDPVNQPPFDKPPRDQQFDGVSGKDLFNPLPPEFGGGVATISECTDFTAPQPNPNEAYADVYGQMFNVNPPPDVIPNPADSPSMQGFAANYASVIAAYNAKHSDHPAPAHPGDVLQCFRPQSLPVINGLANHYAVCDRWFASVPTETFPNRSFAIAGTSDGYVYNNWKIGKLPFEIGLMINRRPTIFNLLEAGGVNWRIYHGGSLLTSFAFLLHDQIRQFASPAASRNRFYEMDQFFADAATAGGLPSYSYIEPRYFSSFTHGPQNDMHPDYLPLHSAGLSNVEQGEQLIHDVYQALRNGPNWESTLLVITFDEHGGIYDHVAPPAASAPDETVISPAEPGGSGFVFNRLGVRVPAVLVSPWIEPGLICHTTFDHTSILKTVIECFEVKDANGEQAMLLERERQAADLSVVLTLAEPRTDTPEIKPNLAAPTGGTLSHPLAAMRYDLLHLAAHCVRERLGELMDFSQADSTEQVAQLLAEKSAALIASNA